MNFKKILTILTTLTLITPSVTAQAHSESSIEVTLKSYTENNITSVVSKIKGIQNEYPGAKEETIVEKFKPYSLLINVNAPNDNPLDMTNLISSDEPTVRSLYSKHGENTYGFNAAGKLVVGNFIHKDNIVIENNGGFHDFTHNLYLNKTTKDKKVKIDLGLSSPGKLIITNNYEGDDLNIDKLPNAEADNYLQFSDIDVVSVELGENDEKTVTLKIPNNYKSLKELNQTAYGNVNDPIIPQNMPTAKNITPPNANSEAETEKTANSEDNISIIAIAGVALITATIGGAIYFKRRKK